MGETGVFASEWETERVDLARYLDRIGVDPPAFVDVATLRLLHRAHVLTIPFENLDIVLGRGIPLDLDSVQAKLVNSPRGGYCYEHNMLFAAVLERLGCSVTRMYGRPLLDAPKPLPRTHLVLRVELDDTSYLVDVGFGDDGPVEPIPLVDGVVVDQHGWVYRARRNTGESGGWVLSLRRAGTWSDLYWFATEPHHHVDCEVANHYIATHPRSPFTGRVFAESITTERRVNLNNRRLTRRTPDTAETATTTLHDDELGDVLREHFDIHLTVEEVDALVRALPPTER